MSHQKLSVNVYEKYLMENIYVPADKNTCNMGTYVKVQDSVLLGYSTMSGGGDPILMFRGNVVTVHFCLYLHYIHCIDPSHSLSSQDMKHVTTLIHGCATLKIQGLKRPRKILHILKCWVPNTE